jgi:4-amino-4-deoxy-L-arabinose transferase-like glycosyltransferase
MISSSSVKLSFDGKKRYLRVGAVLAGIGITLFVLVLYLRTLAPTVLYLESPLLLDAAMLQMQVCVLGITHPTGYPTYLMLSHLFTYLPFGDCAYRVNLASAVYAALAVSVVYAAGLLLSRRPTAAAIAALAFGLGATFWSQAVIAEVYTLNALFVALTLLTLLLWRERRRDRYLLLSAFLVGMSMTNHLTSGLLLPASILFVALVDRRKLVDARLALKGVGLFLLGLTPYLYLPIRAATGAPFKANNPTNFERFWYMVSGGNLRGSFFAFGPAEQLDRLAFYWGYLVDDFHWGLVAAAIIGFVALIVWDRAAAALLGFLFFGWLFHAIGNNIPDIQLYFIPTYLVLALAMAVGLGLLLTEAQNLLARFPRAQKGVVLGVLSVALLLLPLLGVGKAHARNDMSDDYRGRELLEDVVENVKPNATVLHHRSNLWYMVLIEKRRRDLTLVDPFYHNKNVSYADIVWPADVDLATANRRYGTDDFTGITAAKKATENGPVYIYHDGEIDRRGFREAGFRIVHVEGILYELVPPRGGPHSGEKGAS